MLATHQALFALYPVTEVQLTVGTVWDAPIAGLNGQTFGDVFQDFGVLQEQQGQRDEYWYGMITGAATRATYCQSCGQGAYEHGGGNFDRATPWAPPSATSCRCIRWCTSSRTPTS